MQQIWGWKTRPVPKSQELPLEATVCNTCGVLSQGDDDDANEKNNN